MPTYKTPEEWWHALLMNDHPALPLRQFRAVFGRLPASPRCTFCNAPMHGAGAPLMRLIGNGPSKMTPHLCRRCEDTASEHLGGAEIELSFLFADVRGSTPLAERLPSAELRQLINRFFSLSADILIDSGAWIEKFIGDEIVGLYIPGFAGVDHARKAVQAAQEILRATGHTRPDGPWLPVGVGVHTGTASVGAIGAAGRATHIAAIGENVNITARLMAKAGPGEIIMSEAAYAAARLDLALEQRQLELKGISQPFGARVLSVKANSK